MASPAGEKAFTLVPARFSTPTRKWPKVEGRIGRRERHAHCYAGALPAALKFLGPSKNVVPVYQLEVVLGTKQSANTR